ncbi:hypothetical protein [Flavobacterium pedocola]
MRIRNFTLLLFIVLTTNFLSAQSIEGFLFSDYKVKKTTNKKKAKIDFNSNKTAKRYKTAIADEYTSGKVNFAGHYIICTWGCGTGCLDGAMVDVTNGKVYNVPMGESRYFYGCVFDEGEDCLEFQDDSRLFITQYCVQSNDTDEKDIQQKEYFVNIWNEKTKQFEFIKSVKTKKTVPTDY